MSCFLCEVSGCLFAVVAVVFVDKTGSQWEREGITLSAGALFRWRPVDGDDSRRRNTFAGRGFCLFVFSRLKKYGADSGALLLVTQPPTREVGTGDPRRRRRVFRYDRWLNIALLGQYLNVNQSTFNMKQMLVRLRYPVSFSTTSTKLSRIKMKKKRHQCGWKDPGESVPGKVRWKCIEMGFHFEGTKPELATELSARRSAWKWFNTVACWYNAIPREMHRGIEAGDAQHGVAFDFFLNFLIFLSFFLSSFFFVSWGFSIAPVAVSSRSSACSAAGCFRIRLGGGGGGGG